jgi:hypothetical protein
LASVTKQDETDERITVGLVALLRDFVVDRAVTFA